MPPVEFESTYSASERPKTYALDCAATGTGNFMSYYYIFLKEDNLKSLLIVHYSVFYFR
jgi:hypothetical protein